MKSKWFRRMLAGALSAAMMCGLAGCGDVALEETDELHIYNPVKSDMDVALSSFYGSIMAEYAKRYPDVLLYYRTSDMDYDSLIWGADPTPKMSEKLQEYYNSVSVNIMKGKCEDVAFADTFYQWFDDVIPPDYNKMIRAGAFADLKPLLAKAAPDLNLSMFDSLQIDGKLYAVPVYRQPYVIYSAENLLSEWGFDYNPKDDILTFLRKCADWKEKHASDEDAPIVFSKQTWDYIYYNIFSILGANVVDYEAGKANFNDPQVLEVIELLKTLKSDREEPLISSMGNDPGKTYGQFLFGRSGGAYDTIVLGAYGYNYLDDQVVMMPLNQLDGRIATASDTYLMIPENAKNKLNAARYIALILEEVVKHQRGDADAVSMRGFNRNGLIGWDAGEEGVSYSLSRPKMRIFVSQNMEEAVWDMYHNQGDICMPPYWYHSLKYLFDDYMAGKISIDTLASDVQSRLEIYVTE